MSTVAGYTLCFSAGERLRQITIAELDEARIDQMLCDQFGDELQMLSRMAVDARVLHLLNLRRGHWVEWMPMARRDADPRRP